jgi:hypothetical protein
MTIDVKSEKCDALKRDMFSLLKDCLDVSLYDDATNNTLEIKVFWNMGGKRNLVCSNVLAKKKTKTASLLQKND